MKRKYILLISVILSLCLSACSNNKNHIETTNIPIQEENSNNELIEKIDNLNYSTTNNNIQYFDFENHTEIKIDNITYAVYCNPHDEYFNNIIVSVGDKKTEYEDYCYEINSAYWIKMYDKNYILVTTTYDNDYQSTHLFSVTDEPKHIGVIDANVLDIDIDENQLLISGKFKVDVIGSYQAINTYTINNENDMFMLVGDVYDLHQDEKELTLAQPLEVTIEGDEVITLEKGTKIKPIATDAIHTFYFLLEDGRQGYFEYEETMQEFGNETKWELMIRTINEIPEEEVFEFLPYAG